MGTTMIGVVDSGWLAWLTSVKRIRAEENVEFSQLHISILHCLLLHNDSNLLFDNDL